MAAVSNDLLPDRMVDHHLRGTLSDELDARPPTDLSAPAIAACLTVVATDAERRLEDYWLADLARRHRASADRGTESHREVTAADFQLKCERHTEFTSYFVYGKVPEDFSSSQTLAELFPGLALGTLPGRLLHVCVVELQQVGKGYPNASLGQEQPRVASVVAGGAANVCSAYRVGQGGYTLFHVAPRDERPHVLGRIVQAVHEIESYRMMSMLALPLARDVLRAVSEGERQLAELSGHLVFGSRRSDDELLERLLALAAEVERSVALTQFRFSAAAAYYALVEKRIEDLCEVAANGEATIRRFLERRLAPAMRTCETASSRQQALSKRIHRAAMLLRTRVEIARHHEATSMLAALNQRLQLQLRLQQTVEGLSIVAMTYYGVALAAYLLRGLRAFWRGLELDVAVAVTAPLVAFIVWFAIRRIRRTGVPATRRAVSAAPTSPGSAGRRTSRAVPRPSAANAIWK